VKVIKRADHFKKKISKFKKITLEDKIKIRKVLLLSSQ